eukprot:6186185-Pleurochrysis_carterae.AAC.5
MAVAMERAGLRTSCCILLTYLSAESRKVVLRAGVQILVDLQVAPDQAGTTREQHSQRHVRHDPTPGRAFTQLQGIAVRIIMTTSDDVPYWLLHAQYTPYTDHAWQFQSAQTIMQCSV